MDTRQWPIDFDSLCIGARVTADVIEAAYGVVRTDPKYRLKQLALTEAIRRQRPELDPYIRSNGFDIIIMDDAEASRHQRGRFEVAARQIVTTHRRTMGVDVTKLEPSEATVHERALYANGRIVSALKDTKKELKLEAAQRKTPLMLEDDD